MGFHLSFWQPYHVCGSAAGAQDKLLSCRSNAAEQQEWGWDRSSAYNWMCWNPCPQRDQGDGYNHGVGKQIPAAARRNNQDNHSEHRHPRVENDTASQTCSSKGKTRSNKRKQRLSIANIVKDAVIVDSSASPNYEGETHPNLYKVFISK